LQILESVLDVCRTETAPKKAVSLASYGRFFF
jgi:hypothetical protein